MKDSRRFLLLIVGYLCFAGDAFAQNLPYGNVIGGMIEEGGVVRSFLRPNEQGIRVTVINTRGGGGATGSGGGGGGGRVQTMDVPVDTDYLELLINYLGIDPRFVRKNKITLYRVVESGEPPYLSKNMKRIWTSYNFSTPYKKGGPFELLQAGDIIIIESKGIFNREIFDFMADIRFLVSLPTFILSIYLVVNTFK